MYTSFYMHTMHKNAGGVIFTTKRNGNTFFNVTASAKRLCRNIGVEELVPWICSGTNYHDINSLCPPKDSRSRGGGTVSRDALWPDTSL